MGPDADDRDAPAASLPIRLSQASGVPFYRQIVDQVAGLVHSGQLPPDARLPSFRDLAPKLLVSLITVRRAYADLEAAGLIVRRQGQGTFVASAVEGAARRRALSEAKAQLAEAFTRARQMGLRGDALRSAVEGLLEEDEGEATKPTRSKGEAR
ncbi:MAG: GntR family transcriptional regulator [Vicinamibacteria bacterium]